MASIRIDNVRVLEPGRGLVGTSLRIVDDRVEAIDPQPTAGDERVIDGRGHLVTPGLIDVHTHGIETCVFERDAQEMRDGLRRLAKYGVTCCLPTLYRVMERHSPTPQGDPANPAPSPGGAVPGPGRGWGVDAGGRCGARARAAGGLRWACCGDVDQPGDAGDHSRD